MYRQLYIYIYMYIYILTVASGNQNSSMLPKCPGHEMSHPIFDHRGSPESMVNPILLNPALKSAVLIHFLNFSGCIWWKIPGKCSWNPMKKHSSTAYIYIWINYNISLIWIKAIWVWFPFLTMIPVRSRWGRYNLPRCIHIRYHTIQYCWWLFDAITTTVSWWSHPLLSITIASPLLAKSHESP